MKHPDLDITPQVPQTPEKPKNWVRISLWIFATVLAILLILRLLIASPVGSNILESQIENRVIAGQTIQIEGLKGDILGKFRFKTLSISDETGEWLTAQNGQIEWKPFSLASKTLHIVSTDINAITLSKRPEFETENTNTENKDNSPPFIKRFIVDDVNLPFIQVKEGLGLPASDIGLSASLDIGGSQNNFKLISTSADVGKTQTQIKDTATVDLEWSLQKLLTGSVQIQIPQNGFVSSLLPKPLENDLRITFDGNGNLKDWQSIGKVLSGDKTLASIDGKSVKSQTRINIISDLEGFELAAPLTKRLGTTMRLDLEGDLSSLKNANLAAHLDSRVMDISTTGPINLRQLKMLEPWKIEADAESLAQLTGQDDLNADAVSFAGDWMYSEENASVNGNITAQNISYGEQRIKGLEAGINAALDETDLSIESDITLRSPFTNIEAADKLLGDTLNVNTRASLSPDTQVIDIHALKLKSAFLSANAEGQIDPNGEISLDAETTVSNIEKITDFASGTVFLNTNLQRKGLNQPLNITVSSDRNSIEIQNDELAAVLNSSPTLSANASVSENGDIQFKGRLGADQNTAAFTGRLIGQRLTANANLAIPTFSLDETNIETLNVSAKLNGPISKLDFASDASLVSAIIAGRNIANAKLVANGTLQDGAVTSNLLVDSMVDTFPLNAAIELKSADIIEITRLDANWADLKLNANAKLGGSVPLNAQLKLAGPLTPLSIDGRVDIEGVIDGQMIDVSGQTQNVKFGTTLLETSDLTIKGSMDAIDFAISSSGNTKFIDPDTPIEINIKGIADLSSDIRSINANLDGILDETKISTQKPLIIESQNSETTLKTTLNGFGGLLDVQGKKTDTDLNLETSISDVSINQISSLFGRDGLTGNINANANWHGTSNEGAADYSLDITDAGRKGDSIAHIEASAVGQFIEGRFVSIIEAHNGSDLNMDAVFSTPLLVTNGLPSVNSNEVSRLDIGALGKLEAVWAIIGLDSVDLNGFFDINAEAEAPLAELRPIGKITVSDTSFEHDRYGSRMHNIDVEANFDTASLELISATATGLDGGTVEGSGSIFWDQEKQSALRTRFKNFGALKFDGVGANFTGDLDVARAQDGIQISGDLNVNEAKINIAQFGSSGVKTVDVVFVDEMQNGKALEPKVSPTSRMALDINVKADRRVFVTGRGVNIEMAASTKIGGTLKKPDVRGGANIVRGNFSLLGQPFEFTSGSVRLDGNPMDATTEMKANRTSDGITSSIIVSGQVRSPEISFASSPDLPEDEIISRLLFGRSPSRLSAVEAAQLAVAAASITGDGQGFAPLADLQNAIGLDRLAISQDANNAPQLETGKYLSDDVYVELRSRSGGESDLAIEWEAIDNVEIGTVFGDETGARVSVEWKKELD